MRPEHKSDAGPDLWLDSIGAWAEIVTATNGDPSNLNSLNPCEENEDKKLLRFTNAIAVKTAKFNKDIQENRVNPSDKLIICIYPWITNRLPCHPANGLPDIVRAVYPAGDYQLVFNKSTQAIENHQYSFLDVIQKRKADGSIASIYTNTFLNVQNSHISGVLFSPNPGNFLNHSEIGSDFIFVHNALAQNIVLPGKLNVGEEYTAELSIQKHLNKK